MAPESYDILIIGAGAAGLAAGRVLAAAGRRVAIIEARDRIGGRILTRHVSLGSRTIPVELGAEFVHGLPAASWQLIGEAGLAAYELDGSQLCYRARQLEPCGEEQGDATTILEQLDQWIADQPPGTDISFADYLVRARVDAAAGLRATAYVEGFNAADAGRIGAQALVRQQRAEDAIEGDRLFHVADGYDAIPQFLSARFSESGGVILLGKPVTDVTWTEGSVTARGIDAAGAAFQVSAACAVITLPLGVLQSHSVKFDPEPSAVLAHARRLAMGEVRRITLVFKHAFWRSLGSPDVSFIFAPGETLPTWWTPAPDDAPVITAWIGGPKAAQFERQLEADGGQTAIVDACIAVLSQLFGLSTAELRAELSSAHTHDWTHDRYARGAYSYAPVDAVDASGQMTAAVAGTLYFAGEHTDTSGHWGTVHAALSSGQRAAKQILGGTAR